MLQQDCRWEVGIKESLISDIHAEHGSKITEYLGAWVWCFSPLLMTSWSNSWEGAAARYEKLKTQEIFQSKQKFQRCLNSATSTLDLMHRSGAKYEFHWWILFLFLKVLSWVTNNFSLDAMPLVLFAFTPFLSIYTAYIHKQIYLKCGKNTHLYLKRCFSPLPSYCASNSWEQTSACRQK